MFSLETCPPYNLSNGNVTYSREARDGRYSPGTVVRPVCDEGFVSEGNIIKASPSSQQCDAGGNWAPPFIRCIGETIR